MPTVDANACRHDPSGKGHYESWFVRATHPSRPLAIWIRYTSYDARDGSTSEGELWGTWFDGERDRIVTAYQAYDAARCHFGRSGLDVRIGEATLVDGDLRGSAEGISWNLGFTPSPPILLFPEAFYDKRFPKAKQLTASPTSRITGTVVVDGETHALDAWPGSQSHNWGPQHTDLYAWGQVSAFDDDPDAYLECASAKLKMGVWLPMLSPVVLRLDGQDHLLNGPRQWLRNRGDFRDHSWQLRARGDGLEVSIRFSAAADDFARLTYRNPPGGTKTCLNSKLATCELTVRRPGRPDRSLVASRRAAFEILGDPPQLAARAHLEVRR